MSASDFVRDSTPADIGWIHDVLAKQWHGPLIERGDEFVDASKLPCLIAERDGDKVGLATLLIGDNFLEIITINSFQEGIGVGTSLIDAAIGKGRELGKTDLRLFTTNDNIHAIGFYQKRGLHLHALHLGTMTRARTMKPEIPLVGKSGIPIRDEIELRINLDFPNPE